MASPSPSISSYFYALLMAVAALLLVVYPAGAVAESSPMGLTLGAGGSTSTSTNSSSTAKEGGESSHSGEEGGAKHEAEVHPFSSGKDFLNTLVYLLAFVIVLVAAKPLGLFFPRHLKLPLITGYLFVGIAIGPFVANLLTNDLIKMLAQYVNAMALSFISFQAGQEIYYPELKPQIRGILILLASLYTVTMIIVTSVLYISSGAFFYGEFTGMCKLAIALMFGSIAVLGSPATVMAIKIELNSNGPFTNLMLGGTMTAEFVVLVSFSISRIISSIYCAQLNVSAGNLLFTISIVLGNILLGAFISLFIIAIFLIPGNDSHHHHPHQHEDLGVIRGGAVGGGPGTPAGDFDDAESRVSGYANQRAGPSHSARRVQQYEVATEEEIEFSKFNNAKMQALEDGSSSSSRWSFRGIFGSLFFKGFVWLLLGFVFYVSTNIIAETTVEGFGLTWEVKFEPLLVLMVASCIAGHYTRIRHDMHVILDNTAPYMFLPFFVMTGAALKLDQVLNAVPLMSLFVALRFFSIFIACYIAGRYFLKLPKIQYDNLWLTLSPQAGVALGLANEVKGLSSDPWAAEFASTILAAVVVNQIIGPVLCAMGLKKAGESNISGSGGEVDSSDGYSDNTATPKVERGDMESGASTLSRKKMASGGFGGGNLGAYFRLKSAVVIGDSDLALEIALQLALQGAKVTVPQLDKDRAAKWEKLNETIRTGNIGEEISFSPEAIPDRDADSDDDDAADQRKRSASKTEKAKQEKKSRRETRRNETRESMRKISQASDVIIFAGGEFERVQFQVNLLSSSLRRDCPRLIAVMQPSASATSVAPATITTPAQVDELRRQGVLIIQPTIALGNITTRIAMAEDDEAQALSMETSSSSNFSLASYLMRHPQQQQQRGIRPSMVESSRRLSYSRNLLTPVDRGMFDGDDYFGGGTPTQQPPARVSMFGLSAPAPDYLYPPMPHQMPPPHMMMMHPQHMMMMHPNALSYYTAANYRQSGVRLSGISSSMGSRSRQRSHREAAASSGGAATTPGGNTGINGNGNSNPNTASYDLYASPYARQSSAMVL